MLCPAPVLRPRRTRAMWFHVTVVANRRLDPVPSESGHLSPDDPQHRLVGFRQKDDLEPCALAAASGVVSHRLDRVGSECVDTRDAPVSRRCGWDKPVPEYWGLVYPGLFGSGILKRGDRLDEIAIGAHTVDSVRGQCQVELVLDSQQQLDHVEGVRREIVRQRYRGHEFICIHGEYVGDELAQSRLEFPEPR